SFNGCCQQPLKTQTWAPFKKLAVAALSKLKIKADFLHFPSPHLLLIPLKKQRPAQRLGLIK
ncbi:MAG TPA: hypothetical protein VND64_32445, partial [Pirellulales bacterium]|nr:hypothetical protein [Pirellulales bacterium]